MSDEHPDLIDKEEDRWTWGVDKRGRHGYILVKDRGEATVIPRSVIENDFGPVREEYPTLRIELPKVPENVTRLVDPMSGREFRRNCSMWQTPEGEFVPLLSILSAYPGGVDAVVETPYDAAMRYFRTVTLDEDYEALTYQEQQYAITIINHLKEQEA